jgi:hypothetical protein
MHTQRQQSTSHTRRIGALLVALLSSVLASCPAAQAAEFACAAGDVACLITAIQAANANGEANAITLEAGTYTLTAVDNTTDGANGLPSITSPLTIRGAGAERTTIARAAGAPLFRLVHVTTASPLLLEGLTLSGGDITIANRVFSGSGGGLYNRGGTVLLTYSRLMHNQAVSCGGINTAGTVFIIHSTVAGNRSGSLGGGGICSAGTVIVLNSTVADNQAHGGPGGGILNDGTVTLTNSTLAGNTGLFGGGMWNRRGSVTLTNSTLAYNWADGPTTVVCGGGGGLCTSSGTVTLQNTILARNTAQSGPDCRGLITSEGNNLLGDLSDCTITLQSSDLTGDPSLDAFTDDGTPGHGYFPLLLTSQAVNAGTDAACPPTDQLGQPRVGQCDIGAIEFLEQDDRRHGGGGGCTLRPGGESDPTLGALLLLLVVSRTRRRRVSRYSSTVASAYSTVTEAAGIVYTGSGTHRRERVIRPGKRYSLIIQSLVQPFISDKFP